MTPMATTTILTARFGEVSVDDGLIIQFIEPILGFKDSLKYVILDHAENSPFKWLQSANEPDLAFVVTNPKFFGIDYEFVLSDEIAGKLSLQNAEDALVLTIVNIPQNDPGKMTANLLGPIIVNQATRLAMQVVLNDVNYSTKTRLIPDDVLQQQATSSGADKGE
jgi:flagellar assembly factor FliW